MLIEIDPTVDFACKFATRCWPQKNSFSTSERGHHTIKYTIVLLATAIGKAFWLAVIATTQSRYGPTTRYG